MPRPAVYGKKTRSKFDPLGANFSSPEQPLPKPEKQAAGIHIRFDDSEHEEPVKEKKSSRRALGERNNNAVVVPLEAIEHVEKKTKKPKSTRRKDERKEDDAKPSRRKTRKEAAEPVEAKGDIAVAVEPVHEEAQPDEAPLKEIKHSRGEKQNTRQEAVPEPEIQQPVSTPELQDPTKPHEKHCSALLSLSNHPLTLFSTWSAQLSEHFSVTKIAEASFGEVYRLSLRSPIPDFSSTDESVFKIIPLQAPATSLPLDKRKRTAFLKKQETMSKPLDVASEVKLLQRMSAIPGFTNFRDVRILQGRPPEAFIEAFKTWNTTQKAAKKELSHFPDPSKKTSYAEDQLWAVIEMQDAGTDLERLVESGDFTSIWTIWDVFWQVVLSLAKGEEGAEFEHRDLHLGNICVRPPTSSEPIDISRNLNFTSLETTIIDYTISRCTLPSPTNEIAFIDLSTDLALFEGDSTEEYQYDIYRYMRSALFHDNGLADFHTQAPIAERSWEGFHPQTNLVWLHLILYKLLEQIIWPSAEKKKHKKSKGEEREKWKRACALEKVLLQVQELLYPGAICANGIRSASDLVVLALSEGWLDVGDVVGHGVGDESALVSQLEGLELRI